LADSRKPIGRQHILAVAPAYQKVRISCQDVPLSKGFDMKIKTPDLFRLLLLKMLHGGENFKNHNFRKKLTQGLKVSVRPNLCLYGL
jgi:hypothetical protein